MLAFIFEGIVVFGVRREIEQGEVRAMRAPAQCNFTTAVGLENHPREGDSCAISYAGDVGHSDAVEVEKDCGFESDDLLYTSTGRGC